MSEKHTELPWRVDEWDGRKIRGASDAHTHGHRRNSQGVSNASYSDLVCEVWGNVCGCDELDPVAPKANAELIVEAVNDHYRLLDENNRLREALGELVKCHSEGGFVQPDQDVLDQAKEALSPSQTEEKP